MPIRLRNIPLGLDEPSSDLRGKAAQLLNLPPEAIAELRVVRRSLDSRGRRAHFVFTAELTLSESAQEEAAVRRGKAEIAVQAVREPIEPGSQEVRGQVVVIGCGPAGLFAALELARFGHKPLLLERGAPIEERQADVGAFLSRRELHPDSNFLFGAGGAGTYSDGKLFTRAHDARIHGILETLVAAGADPDILVDARPHLGTDRLHGIVSRLCGELVARGGTIQWRTRVTGFRTEGGRLTAVLTAQGAVESNCAVLAIGGSARDTFSGLQRDGVALEAKPFQMGLRIEHPRALIDQGVYGPHAGHPRLGAAEYVLSANSVTAFCICPGGTVMATSAEDGTVCTNGMSAHARAGEFTNAALVTTVLPEAFGADPLQGVAFQRGWEQAAYRLAGGNYAAPAQSAAQFLAGSVGPLRRETTYPFGVVPAALKDVLPAHVCQAIASALPEFDRRIPGFAGEEGILMGPETRASCPVRIVRGAHTRCSISTDGLYPAGEGAGYAGGIMSSAVDGLSAAEAIIRRYRATAKS